MPNLPITTGKVIIAGAGPGDPELLTVKALRALQQADVVLADRLVSEQVLVNYVKKGAEIIPVGKQCRRGASTPQEIINELMLEHALQGRLVVRLKGGDVSIFSNMLDELLVLKAAGISYEIIPGVTAALGAAAYGGMPLTARGYSTAVRFLTFYRNEVIDDLYWNELAATDDTLVFYMSSETLDGVVQNLVKNGISPEKLLAVIEQATTPMQHIQVTSLYDYSKSWVGKTFVSPALVIIGKVVGLHQQFAWLNNSNSSEPYFKPVAKLFTASTVATEKVNHHVSRA